MEHLLKVGFVGAGHQAQEQIRILQSSKVVKVSAVSDIHADRSRNVGTKYQIPYYTDYEKMIHQESLDIVYICLPHHLHQKATQYSLLKGLHVVKEKPFALSVNEGKKLIHYAAKKQRSIFTLMQRRGHSTYKLGKKLLEEIGNPYLFRVHYSFNGGPYDFGWRGKKAIAGGGAILDMGYHMLDVILWYFEMPSQVFAYTTQVARPDVLYETEDLAVLMMKKGNSLMGSLVLTRASHPKDEQIVIYGTKGSMKVSRQDVYLWDLAGNQILHVSARTDWQRAIQTQLDTFAIKVLNGQIDHGSYHLQHVQLLEAAYLSQQSGNPVNPLFPMTPSQAKEKEVL